MRILLWDESLLVFCRAAQTVVATESRRARAPEDHRSHPFVGAVIPESGAHLTRTGRRVPDVASRLVGTENDFVNQLVATISASIDDSVSGLLDSASYELDSSGKRTLWMALQEQGTWGC